MIVNFSENKLISFCLYIGIMGYLIAFLGFIHLLYRPLLIFYVGMSLFLFIFIFRNIKLSHFSFKSKNKLLYFTLGLLLIQILINFIGALGPEYAFDSVWYHLTLPKLYLSAHKIYFIPGNLLYYSAMPQLGEMYYVIALALGNEILAKLIHFSFGVLVVIVLYFFSRRYFSKNISIIACLIFSSNLVYAWESTIAYIDLTRTFFELVSLYSLSIWLGTSKRKYLFYSAVFLGFSLSTKHLALGSTAVISFLILFQGLTSRKKIKSICIDLGLFLSISSIIVIPWLLFAYINTGNPVYPFFTEIVRTNFDTKLLSPVVFLRDTFKILLFSDDPISPIYLIIFPLIPFVFLTLKKELKILLLYCLLSYLVWYVTPRIGGGRFMLPYLPVMSIMVAAVINSYWNKILFRNIIIFSVLFIALITIIYRGAAISRNINYLFGKQTKADFLKTHLNFSFGDFYDIDSYFIENITSSDTVLLYGFHNLYYADFNFIDRSWVKKGDKFNYIATQNSDLPKEFTQWKLVYQNSITNVKLYTNDKLNYY